LAEDVKEIISNFQHQNYNLLAIGFTSTSTTFYRAFKKEVGQAPNEKYQQISTNLSSFKLLKPLLI